MLRIFMKWVTNIILIIITGIILFSVYSTLKVRNNPGSLPPSMLGLRSMTVLTGSMRPAIQPGDLVIIRNINSEKVRKGDIVTYAKSKGFYITHRVADISRKDGKLQFTMKGDANNINDSEPIAPEQLIGSMLLKVPYGGYAAYFLRSPVGLTLLVLIPVIFILGGYIKSEIGKDADIKREKLKKRVLGK
jgi:signal peptidase